MAEIRTANFEVQYLHPISGAGFLYCYLHILFFILCAGWMCFVGLIFTLALFVLQTYDLAFKLMREML